MKWRPTLLHFDDPLGVWVDATQGHYVGVSVKSSLTFKYTHDWITRQSSTY